MLHPFGVGILSGEQIKMEKHGKYDKKKNIQIADKLCISRALIIIVGSSRWFHYE